MAEERDRVGELNETLYSRSRYKDPQDKRAGVSESESPEVKEDWQSPKLDELLSYERTDTKPSSFMKKFFIFSFLFFLATLIVGGYVFFGGTNFISSKNVDIEIVGPAISSAGDLLELGVAVENNNNSDLEAVIFSIQYPNGARDPQDSSKTLTFSREELGVIKAGSEQVRNLRLILIGSTGEEKELKLSVEYKVRGSNATFHKDKIYSVTIGDAPLTLIIKSPDQVQSGTDFTTNVSVSLNSDEVLKNVILKAEYPYGYTPVSTTPQALSDNNIWNLGDMAPGSSKKIDIVGQLVGESQDQRTFRFYVGVGNGSSSRSIETVVLSAQNTVLVSKPSVGLSISFNGNKTPLYTAPAGGGVRVSISFQNNLPDKIINPAVEARIGDGLVNKNSISVQDAGTYNPSSNRINWSIRNSQGLQELLPGQIGTVSFVLSSLPDSLERGIEIGAVFSGVRSSGAGFVTANESGTIRVASLVTLSSSATYSLGPFNNSGPIPPKVGEGTKYGIVLSASNTQAEVVETRVTARLGQNVKWVGAHSTGSESISYNQSDNTVTWDLGTLSSGAGFSTASREAAFQVELTPTLAQLGTAPILVSGITLSGTDSSTSKSVTITNQPLTTRLTNDPAFIQGDDIVQR